METLIPSRLTTLGHPQRLAIFRLLMRRYPDPVPAGEIAQALGLKLSTSSAYVAALMQAGLLTQHRVGTSLLYAIDMASVGRLMDDLLLDCCRGRPELCPPFAPASAPGRPYRVLFLCTGNSARSLFAESLLRAEAGDRFAVFSAGTRPQDAPHPLALAMLAAKGHDLAPLRAKPVSEFQAPDTPPFDFVFTVCDQAANEDCPAWPGQPVTAHWGVADPVKAQGTEAQRALAFQQAFGALRNRVLAFAALPLDQIDRLSLQRAVDDIARTRSENDA